MPSPSSLVRFGWVGLPLAIVLGAWYSGCGGSGPRTTDEGGGGEVATGRAIVDRKNCNELLETALDTLQPDQYLLGDDSGATTVLSGWRSNCETAELQRVQGGMVGERTRGLLDAATLARVEEPTFGDDDATHVRTSLLFHDVATAAAGGAEGDVERAANVFAFVMRHVQLLEEDDPLAGLDPFRNLLFGEGSARDRAWIVAALLRQLRIDAVVLRPAGEKSAAGGNPDEATASDDRWLLGVVLENECYLFDPRLGFAIPSAEGDGRTALPDRPATLAEVRDESDLLGSLDLPERPYPLDDADLDDVRIEVVGHSSLWAPRMAGVQRVLHGERATVLVDSLDDPEGLLDPNRGIVLRLTDAIDGWTAEQIAVWPYPEERMRTSLQDLSADRRSAVLSRGEAFSSASGGGSRYLLLGRLQQLRGVHTSSKSETNANSSFTNVRTAANASVEARQNAGFWSAQSLLEAGDGRGDGSLRLYLDGFPNGRFARTAHLLRALRRAEDDPERAIAELDRIPADSPDAAAIAFLRHRWSQDE
jgi:hypothetical protein